MDSLLEVHGKLLKAYGPQEWWPMANGFDPPEWEICVGAILTQNTAWSNVEKALLSMREQGCRSAKALIDTWSVELEALVRSSGFYKQKAAKLRILASEALKAGGVESFLNTVTRDKLLEINGIGPETADSILLYAAGRPVFVVDAYTRRVFSRLGIVNEKMTYEAAREFFENGLPRDVKLYRELHALIVRLGKEHCRKEPECDGCPLNRKCAHAKAGSKRK
jgi:endonuclease-3 related protein